MIKSSTKFLSLSCSHVPIHCKETQAKFLERLKEYKPQVFVHMGDLLEADAASRWGSENKWTLFDEQNQAADYLRLIREATGPDCKFIHLLGNHDANVLGAFRIDPKLRESCKSENHVTLGPELKNWKVVPYSHQQVYRLGPVSFAHGCAVNVKSNEDSAMLYGVENGLHIMGHTHRGMDVTRVMFKATIPTDKYCANVGCTADWNQFEYMLRKSKAMWTKGWIEGDVACNTDRTRFATLQWTANLVVTERAR